MISNDRYFWVAWVTELETPTVVKWSPVLVPTSEQGHERIITQLETLDRASWTKFTVMQLLQNSRLFIFLCVAEFEEVCGAYYTAASNACCSWQVEANCLIRPTQNCNFMYPVLRYFSFCFSMLLLTLLWRLYILKDYLLDTNHIFSNVLVFTSKPEMEKNNKLDLRSTCKMSNAELSWQEE